MKRHGWAQVLYLLGFRLGFEQLLAGIDLLSKSTLDGQGHCKAGGHWKKE